MPAPDLHIICFAVPYPPDYGGAIDVWNRIRALQAEGVHLVLHCFVYGAFMPQPELREVAGEVHYYPRTIWPAFFKKGEPYIVTSRKHRRLLERLRADRAPILFEGMQTTAWLDDLGDRKRLLRAHNIEHQYYQRLSQYSRGLAAMMYTREAQCLENYEHTQAVKFDAVFGISPADTDWFARLGARTAFVPPFHGPLTADMEEGTGQYMLYQGDLSIEINQRALLELVRMLDGAVSLPLMVAGKSGPAAFETKIQSFSNLQRIPDVSIDRMATLIRQAQMIFIHSLHAEGMKLKLFPALYTGRFILANELSRTHTLLDEGIHFYQPESFARDVALFSKKSFTASDVTARKALLAQWPDDGQKARQIIRYL